MSISYASTNKILGKTVIIEHTDTVTKLHRKFVAMPFDAVEILSSDDRKVGMLKMLAVGAHTSSEVTLPLSELRIVKVLDGEHIETTDEETTNDH